jgi:hypothetical protein
MARVSGWGNNCTYHWSLSRITRFTQSNLLDCISVVLILLLPTLVLAAPGDIITIAGGSIGDGGLATNTFVNWPMNVAVDSSGNMYIVDRSNDLIRKVDTGGIITTVVGNGSQGYSGDNGPATSASLNYPMGVAVDSSGNIYIADYENNRIRKVDTGGTITTVAGTSIAGYSGDNGPATLARLNRPAAVALIHQGISTSPMVVTTESAS